MLNIEDFEKVYNKELKKTTTNKAKSNFYLDMCHPLNLQGRRLMKELNSVTTIYDNEDTIASMNLYSIEPPSPIVPDMDLNFPY